MAKYIVVLDAGTSSVRAGAVAPDGTLVALHQEALAPQRGTNGTSQYQADALLEAQLRVLTGILREIGPENADSIALSSQRSTVVLWDRQTGEAVAPVLTWEDGRAFAQAGRAPLSQEEVHSLTGLYKTPYFSAPKIAWCLENCPSAQTALAHKTLCVGPIASFLIFHLTKGTVFATDPALAQRTLLFDIHTQAWSDVLCKAFGIDKACLPEIKPSVSDYGYFNYQTVSIPIRVCTADQQAAACMLREGQTRINYGTGAFVLRHTGQACKVVPGLLTSVTCSTDKNPVNYLLEGPVNAAGSVFLWLQKQGIFIDNEKLDALCSSSRHPVSILPALGGLGAPYWNFELSPVIAGLSALTTLEDWAAGTARAIAFLIADIAFYLQRVQAPLEKEVFVSGGLSNSTYLMQFQSDILQTKLIRETVAEGTLLGLAQLLITFPPSADKQQIVPSVSAQTAQKLYQDWRTFFDWVTKK